jgi:molecular chaperone GrpE (heat shock protein)
MGTNQNVLPENELEKIVEKASELLRPLLVDVVERVFAERNILEQETPASEPIRQNREIPNPPGLGETVAGLDRHIRQALAGFETHLQESAYKDKLIKELHEELQVYKNGLRKELLSPLLKHIMHWQGKVVDLYAYYEKEKGNNADVNVLFPNLLLEYRNLSLGLLDLLYDYDVEPLEPKAGDAYDPKLHKALHTLPVDEESRNRTIASCEKIGFVDVVTNRLLKPAEVTVYKYQAQSSRPESTGETHETNE